MDREATTGISGDVLPDEILVHIFGMVDDGVALLDNLPLVCKRWYRAARDPASWAGVRLRFSLDFSRRWERNAALRVVEDRARVLLHAPAAASLASLELYQDSCTPISFCRRLLSALGRSRATVRKLDFNGASETFWDYVAPLFLYRQQQDLRELWVSLVVTWEPSSHYDHYGYSGYGYKQSGDQLAGRLPGLRELHLREWQNKYNGKLIQSIATWGDKPLRHQFHRGFEPRCIHDGMVSSLVRGAMALRILEVDMPLRADDREAFLKLRDVKHVVLNLDGLSFSLFDSPRFVELRRNPRSAIDEAVELCAAMESSLRTVTFKLYHLLSSSASEAGSFRELVDHMTQAGAVKLPNVKMDLANCGDLDV